MAQTSKPRPGLEEASSSPPPTPTFTALVLRELSHYLSELNSVALLSVCATSLRLRRDQLEPKHLPAILAQVESSFDFFGVSPERRDRCLRSLRGLDGAAKVGAVDDDDVTIPVEQEQDLLRARLAGKALCRRLGFTEIGTTKVMTAISELARNIFKYAGQGVIRIRRLTADGVGVQVIASDRGPGIPDVNKVLSPGFHSKTGMGRGLSGTRALMDSFDIQSRPGEGTIVTVQKAKS